MANRSRAADTQRATSHRVEELCDTVETIDVLSQEGFSEISSLARLALCCLEAPNKHHYLGDIAKALKAIKGNADEIQNHINCEAE